MPRLASASGVNFYMYTGVGDEDGPNEYTNATMVFVQSTAPTGWTKDTTYNDYALRVVSGNVGVGGNIDFSNVFTTHAVSGSFADSPFSVGATTLSLAQIPSHSHPTNGSYTFDTLSLTTTPGGTRSMRTPSPVNPTGNAGTGGSHTHTQPLYSVADTFDGNNLNLSIKYVDSILATYTS